MAASSEGHEPVANLLRASEADINAQDKIINEYTCGNISCDTSGHIGKTELEVGTTTAIHSSEIDVQVSHLHISIIALIFLRLISRSCIR